jgi:hypothetical protein
MATLLSSASNCLEQNTEHCPEYAKQKFGKKCNNGNTAFMSTASNCLEQNIYI